MNLFSRLFFVTLALVAWPIQAAEEAGNEPAKPPETEANGQNQAATGDDYELYRALADTIDQVERNYVKPVDRKELMEAAIKGVMSKLDPYSSYIDSDEMANFRTSVESQFAGIGIQLTMDQGQLTVASPLVGTPAYRAGVQAGDRITKIAGKPTDDLTLTDAIKQLKGEPGTEVTFTVEHAASGKTESFTLTREVVRVDTVLGDSRKADDSWEYLIDPKRRIGYIRITAFSRETADDLRKALAELQARQMRGLVLDLRFNPGGLLTSAVEVANLFVGEGRIVSTTGRNVPQRVWDAEKEKALADFPVVVLVNHYSASASEIVAACLQDHHRAAIVGERTWGKGSVQNVVELEGGKTALKLTTASYARPNGHKIHRFPEDKESDEWGVSPDDKLDVKLSRSEMAQLMIERRKRDVVAAKGGEGPASRNAQTAKESRQGDAKDTHSDAAADDEENKRHASANSEEGKSGDSHGAALKNEDERSQHTPPIADRQLKKAIEYLTAHMSGTP
jgi:carboxyl-terminal processing protease